MSKLSKNKGKREILYNGGQSKTGVVIVTCNRLQYLANLLDSLIKCRPSFDNLVIINDGRVLSVTDQLNLDKDDLTAYNNIKLYTEDLNATWIDNITNQGVAKTKNKGIQYLLDNNCDYIFVIEDDMIVLDKNIFAKYIEASIISGIQHFNYGPGSPFNRKQSIKNFDLHNRHLLDNNSEPNPKLIVDYGTLKIALYEHTVAMFTFYTRKCLETVGLIPEIYDQCWEHVDHTYQIIKAGMHPPFWWFADLYESEKYLTEAPGAIENSAIAKDKTEWMKKVHAGREIYKQKFGHYPNEPPYVSKEAVIETIKRLKQK